MKLSKFAMIPLFVTLYVQVYASANKKIDDLANTFMQQNHVEGLSIAVIHNGSTQIFNYGYANELKKIPTSSNTIYRVGSFSKTYTATLASIASVEGKLNLNDPFNKYFPQLKNNSNLDKITTIMLLAHVSSLPFNFTPNPTTSSEAIKDLNQFVPPYPPGSEYAYSNAGIGTVGYILQNIYAKDYDAILADKIAKPLNLTSTYLNLPADKEKYVAMGHERNDNKLRPYDKSIDIWFAAGSMKSSISDMAKFLNAQINYSSLKDKTLANAIMAVHQNKYCLVGDVSCEQLSWQAHTLSELTNSVGDTFFTNMDANGSPVFNHVRTVINNNFPKKSFFIDKTCSGYGMSGYMAYIPEKKLGVVILLNKNIWDERIRLGRDILQSLN